MFLHRWTRDPAGFRPCIGQTEFGCNDGQLGCIWGISFEHDVPDSGIPELRKRIRAFAGDHDKTFGLLCAGKVLDFCSIDHDHAIDSQVRLLYQVDPMRTVPQQRIAQRSCVIRIPNSELNRFHSESPPKQYAHARCVIG